MAPSRRSPTCPSAGGSRTAAINARKPFDFPSPSCRVLIRRFSAPPSSHFRKIRDYSVCFKGDACYFLWKNELSACVRKGTEIWIDPVRGLDDRILELLVHGPLYAMILKQRGFLVFHASAVSNRGRAIAFLGFSGQGKSTLAAAFHFRKNHALVTDNALAVSWDAKGKPLAIPAQPFLKLSGRTTAALGIDGSEYDAIEPGSHKKKIPARAKKAEPARLGCLYVLKDGSEARIEAVTRADAFTELVRHSYFPADAFPPDSGENFSALARLASRLPLRRVAFPHRWDLLDGLMGLIERGR